MRIAGVAHERRYRAVVDVTAADGELALCPVVAAGNAAAFKLGNGLNELISSPVRSITLNFISLSVLRLNLMPSSLPAAFPR